MVNALFIVAPIVCGGLCLVLVLLFSNWRPFKFCYHLGGEERVGCFTLIVFLMYCDCQCSVPLPNGAMG